MSSMFENHILRINNCEVEARIISVHPDSGPVPEHPNYALQMIVEAYWLLKKGYLWDLGISQEQATQLLGQSPYQQQLEDWLLLSHGWEEPVSKEIYEKVDNMSWEERSQHTDYGQLSGWGMSDGEYHLHHRPDYKGFVRLSELMITEFVPINEDTFQFTVLEAGMLAHIQEGFSWETASFDYQYA